MNARVLFLGGNGMIGSAAAREAAATGVELTIVTRSAPRRAVPDGVRVLNGDVRDARTLEGLLGDERWDAVVDWVGFTPADLAGHVDYFGERTGQYLFISTCSVFARPVPLLPITEASPRRQPVFGYARDKIACELMLEQAYREHGFPLTIVRPFHTYDETTVPVLAGWTAVERMRAGAPVIVHGDGTSLWSLMHSSDFARAFVPLLGAGHAIGESVNIVSGDILTWDQIHLELARAAGVSRPLLAHRSSETIGEEIPGWAEVLEHDFRHTMLFDTSTLQRLVPGFAPRVPLSDGMRQVVRFHDEHESARGIDGELVAAFDRLALR